MNPLIPCFKQYLQELKAQIGWGRSDLRYAIQTAEKHLENDYDFDLLMRPFYLVDESRFHDLRLIILNLFSSLFEASNDDYFLTPPDIEHIINIAFSTSREASEETKMKCCKLISSCIHSEYSVHDQFVFHSVMFLLTMYNLVTDPVVQEVASMTLTDISRQIIEKYSEPYKVPKYNSVEKLVKFETDTLIKNAIQIFTYAPTTEKARIQEVDIVMLMNALCQIIENTEMKPNTRNVAAQALLVLFQSDSPFLKTATFKKRFVTESHVAILSLLICEPSRDKANGISLEKVASDLFVVVWDKFSSFYVDGFYELLDKGICLSLASASTIISRRALHIISSLIKYSPQSLIDIFVNYDCDETGSYKNIFTNLCENVIRFAYPKQESNYLQKTSMKTLLYILSALFSYISTNHPGSADESDAILERKKYKDSFDQTNSLFKRSPKKGLRQFISTGLIPSDDPKSIAEFLKSQQRNLDPTAVGEILGTIGNEQILSQYASLFSFAGLTFEQAFRQFLQSFVIPGEAQMIDRILQEFGNAYYTSNPDTFINADSVYALAYSALILHTDQHHPDVKNRMTLDQFISNNKGLNANNTDYPTDLLTDLYNGIKSEQVFAPYSATNVWSLSPEQRSQMYEQEVQNALEQAKKYRGSTRDFIKITSPQIVRAMMDGIWAGSFAALAMCFEQMEGPSIIGFKLTLELSLRCYLKDALAVIIPTYMKFMWKSDECRKSFLKVVNAERSFLRDHWRMIVKYLSESEYEGDLWMNTGTMEIGSLLSLVSALCKQSRKELPNRMYCMMRLSEVAYWNMNRSKYDWRKLWAIIGEFLVREGCSREGVVAENATNILLQLSKKFLAVPETKEFHFQRTFLQPFVQIMDLHPQLQGRVVECIGYLVDSCGRTIKSGWDVILQVVTTAAMEPNLHQQAFEILERSIRKYMKSLIGMEVHLMTTLALFIQMRNDPKDVALFDIISDYIGSKRSATWICLLETTAKVATFENAAVRDEAENLLCELVTKKQLLPKAVSFFYSNCLKQLFPQNGDQARNEKLLNKLKPLFSTPVPEYRDDLVSFFNRVSDSCPAAFAALVEVAKGDPDVEENDLFWATVEKMKATMRNELWDLAGFVNDIERFEKIVNGTEFLEVEFRVNVRKNQYDRASLIFKQSLDCDEKLLVKELGITKDLEKEQVKQIVGDTIPKLCSLIAGGSEAIRNELAGVIEKAME